MNDQESESYLDTAFRREKEKALEFVEQFNERLPHQQCPNCGTEGHVPGLPCPQPECGYLHSVSWCILEDTEFGYQVVALNNRKHVFACFNVEER